MGESGDEVEHILLTTSLHHAPSLLTPFNILPLLLFYRPPSLFCNSTLSSPERRSFGPGRPPHLSAQICRPWSPSLASRLTLRIRQRLRRSFLRRQPYTRSLLVHLARSLIQAPLPSILEPRDLPRFHPFLSAPGVLTVDPPHIPGLNATSNLPACIHRRPFMTMAIRKASATRRAALR